MPIASVASDMSHGVTFFKSKCNVSTFVVPIIIVDDTGVPELSEAFKATAGAVEIAQAVVPVTVTVTLRVIALLGPVAVIV
jgi:hypothetical protein